MFKRPMIFAIVIFLFIISAMMFMTRYLESVSVFYPSSISNLTPSLVGLSYEDLDIMTSDKVLINAWMSKTKREAATVIYAHGNAGSMSERVLKLKFFHDLGLNIIMFDYRGYGRSQGRPTEKGVYLDAQAVYDYLKTRQDIDPDKIIAYGSSLGGTVMIDLATKRKLTALVIESSFTSAAAMSKKIYPMLPTFLMNIKFDSISKIDKINAPKLLLHSPEDQVVPYSMGQELFKAAKEPKSFITTFGGHNDDLILNSPKIAEEFKQFLRSHSLL